MGARNYVVPKGKLYFDQFADNVVVGALTRGSGERYFGNTPGFSTSSSSENLDHFSSDGGLKVKDESVQLSLDRTATMSCDNISDENLALFLQGATSTITQAAATGVSETLTVQKGNHYQLGVSAALPAGVRSVASVAITIGATPVVQAGNYTVDLVLGRIYIEDAAPGIVNGAALIITYNVAAGTRQQTISGNTTIYGSMRLVADNPKGANKDFYFPYVKLQPDGDFELKSDTWQTINFAVEILKKADTVSAIYVDGRPV